MNNINNDKNKKISIFLKTGVGFFVGGLGATAGALTGSPSMIIAGSAFGNAMVSVLNDVVDRSLSNREQMRMSATAIIAYDKIEDLLKQGHSIRDDGFFDSKQILRADAEEIFEAVLLKNKNEHEERKLQFTANIFANVCINAGITSFEANHYLKLSESLSYNQLCFLSYLFRKEEFPNLKLSNKNLIEESVPLEPKNISMLEQINDMYQNGLVALFMEERIKANEMKILTYEDSTAILGITDITPAFIRPTELGSRLFDVMNLADIDSLDIVEMCSLLDY